MSVVKEHLELTTEIINCLSTAELLRKVELVIDTNVFPFLLKLWLCICNELSTAKINIIQYTKYV